MNNKLVFPVESNCGLTKRELFAAMAMQGVLSNSYRECGLMTEDDLSGVVEQADALVKALGDHSASKKV